MVGVGIVTRSEQEQKSNLKSKLSLLRLVKDEIVECLIELIHQFLLYKNFKNIYK